MIPLFPELRPHTEQAWELAGPGTEFVIQRYRSMKQNLGTQLRRIVRRAGVEPWPKLFQNLRSTRETELMEKYPAHVVCAWIGNSEAVAWKHYLQVTDEHFAAAARGESSALQNPVQQPAERTRIEPQGEKGRSAEVEANPELAICCKSLLDNGIPLRGVEPRFSD